jgi:glycosyltransferase involved in cell wall biosynthesis
MKILLVNKFFYPRGGAENSFFETARLLERNGHSVAFFSMEHPKNNPSAFALLHNLRAAGRIHYSFEARKKIEKLIEAERPDIAHLNNISHQISPSIIDSLRKFGIPIVMSLRDYKLTCPVYTLLRDGKLCEECSGGRFYKVFTNRCTKVNMTEMYLHHQLMHIYDKIDEFISPSRFLLEKTLEMGFKGSINHLPNFVNTAEYTPSYSSEGDSIVYVGRLSEEKGVSTLIESVKDVDIKLKIIGDGPLMSRLQEEVRASGQNNVFFLGFKSGDELKDEIRNSLFSVIPSEWYENNPRSVLEAFALGKPVVGARIGGIPELVKDNETGFLFTSGSSGDLNCKIKLLLDKKPVLISLGKNARKFVEDGFNPETHYAGLMKIYETAVIKSKNHA